MLAVQISTSVKTIQIGYVVVCLRRLESPGYLLAIHNQDDRMWALLALPALAMLYLMCPAHSTEAGQAAILDDRLRYEAGFLSKTTRTMELTKIQDVRVDQTVGQRMLILAICRWRRRESPAVSPCFRRPPSRSGRPDSGISARAPSGCLNAVMGRIGSTLLLLLLSGCLAAQQTAPGNE